VRADDRRALFVGADAYQAAGGTITRDLFIADDNGYFADAALLNRLAQEKLQTAAAAVKAEGWKWVEVMPSFDHGFTADMRRIYPKPVPLSDEDQTKLDACEAQFNALCEDESEESQAESERLEAEIAALTGPEQYRAEEFACGGAIVSLMHNGGPRIERGFVRPEDDIREPAAKAKRTSQDGKAPLSDKLVAELTAHRTMALRDAVGAQPDVGLIAVVHALAAATFFGHADRVSCLHLVARSSFLAPHAPSIEESPAAGRIAARHEAWAQRMPEQADDLWTFVAGLGEAERLLLLAHCAALGIDAVQAPHARERLPEANVTQLIEATGLDMAAHWKPTAAGYFGRVSKDRILEAVAEAVSPAAADNIKSLKKGAMAEAAESRMKESGWVPPLLRAPIAAEALPIAAE
jgi:ParB family chromosome partitioning protein